MRNGKRVVGNFLLERGFLKKKGEKLFLSERRKFLGFLCMKLLKWGGSIYRDLRENVKVLLEHLPSGHVMVFGNIITSFPTWNFLGFVWSFVNIWMICAWFGLIFPGFWLDFSRIFFGLLGSVFQLGGFASWCSLQLVGYGCLCWFWVDVIGRLHLSSGCGFAFTKRETERKREKETIKNK